MMAIVAARPPVLAGLLPLLALLLAGPLSAGLLTTDRTVPNFVFKGALVNYRPDSRLIGLSAGATTSLAARLPDLAGGAPAAQDPLGGALHLNARRDNYGNLAREDFDLFGSLPAADSRADEALFGESVKALAEDSKGGRLDQLIDRDPVVGPLASRYRGAGIFMLVAGVDDLTWIQGYQDAASTVALLSLEDAVANGDATSGDVRAAPLPGSLALLAAGLPLLMRRRRRSRP